jgi:hypothetical protein
LTTSGSRYLYGSMRYMPPQAGFDISGTIYGAQPGTNKPGNYIGMNTYDPATGVQFQEAGDNKPVKPDDVPDEIWDDLTDEEKKAALEERDYWKKRGEDPFKVRIAKTKGKCCPEKLEHRVTEYYHPGNWAVGKHKAALLDVYASWTNDPSPCDCSCCAYRQWVKGYHTDAKGVKFGKDVETPLDVPQVDPKTGKVTQPRLAEDVYQEDGDRFGHHWGHKQADLAIAEEYKDCSFKMRDFITTTPPESGAYFTFELRIIDTCNKDAVVKTKTVQVTQAEGTVPSAQFDPVKHAAGPPSDWP